jgi:hypothetical protein
MLQSRATKCSTHTGTLLRHTELWFNFLASWANSWATQFCSLLTCLKTTSGRQCAVKIASLSRKAKEDLWPWVLDNWLIAARQSDSSTVGFNSSAARVMPSLHAMISTSSALAALQITRQAERSTVPASSRITTPMPTSPLFVKAPSTLTLSHPSRGGIHGRGFPGWGGFRRRSSTNGLLPLVALFVSLVADGWCWFVLRENYCWLICYERKVLLAGGW